MDDSFQVGLSKVFMYWGQGRSPPCVNGVGLCKSSFLSLAGMLESPKWTPIFTEGVSWSPHSADLLLPHSTHTAVRVLHTVLSACWDWEQTRTQDCSFLKNNPTPLTCAGPRTAHGFHWISRRLTHTSTHFIYMALIRASEADWTVKLFWLCRCSAAVLVEQLRSMQLKPTDFVWV